MASPPTPIGCLTALNPECLGVALMLKGDHDMAQITINLPDHNSPKGVTLETLEKYVNRRGDESVEEFVNMIIADTMGFRPPIEGSKERFPQLHALRDSLTDDDK